MSWTWHAENADREDASDTTFSVTLTVSPGDLIVAVPKWEGADTTVTMMVGAEAMTEWDYGTVHIRTNEPWSSFFYKIATAESGSVTVTMTLGAARAFKDLCVMSYTPSAGTVTKHTIGLGAAGSSTAPASGNRTTTSTDCLVFGFNAGYGTSLSSPLINTLAAEESVGATVGTHTWLWARRFAAGFTGQASATLSGSARWGCGIIAFDLAAGGATIGRPVLRGGAALRSLTMGRVV